jgi:hypothetical protein
MVIRLETEYGSMLRELCDSNDVVTRLIASCVCDLPPLRLAQFIMPFGKTVFNKLQMAYLFLDVERLVVKAADAEDFGVLRQLQAFILECQSDVHVYVTFNGSQVCA